MTCFYCPATYTAAAGADEQPVVREIGPVMTAGYPKFRRLGAVSPSGESSPFVFRGKLYRAELADPNHTVRITGTNACVEIREAVTGRLVSKTAEGCYYQSACAFDGRVYVTGTRVVRWPDGMMKSGSTVMLFESDDLVHWRSRELFSRPGWRLFNTSMTKSPDGYVIVVETNHPKTGVPFTMFFAHSKDLKAWTFSDDNLAFPQRWYSGGPFLVWRKGWYYLSLVTELPYRVYCTCLYRTRDFKTWEFGAYNPFMTISNEDRQLSPHAHSFTPEQRERVKKAFVCSHADLEMCDFEGRTYIVYGIGDQRGYAHFAEAWYDGPMDELLENFFK